MKILLALILTVALFGCSSTDFVAQEPVVRLSKPTEEVKSLLVEPDRPYKTIARIQLGPDRSGSDYHTHTKRVLERAAEMGADAIIFDYGSEIARFNGTKTESRVTVGQAIVYED